MIQLTGISLFSGAVDGLAIAARAAGIHVTHHVEWDAWCCRVLRMNHPDAEVINADIKTVKGLPYADVIFGGSPCQDFSLAGNRAGFDGERYLWPEMRRIVRECRPRCVIHENVRGGLSAGLLDRICSDLEADGYTAWPLVFPSVVFGAPHERYRMFIVGFLADTSSQRRAEPGTQPVASADQKQHLSSLERAGRTVADAAQSGGQNVVNPIGSGRGEHDIPRIASDSGHADWRPDAAMGITTSTGLHQPIEANGRTYSAQDRTGLDDRPERSGAVQQSSRLSQPGVGGTADGVATGLHRFDPLTAFPGFPAGQGVYQHAYEPPRTTPTKGEYANDRIQALGNAVVWQQAAPVFRTAVKFLNQPRQYLGRQGT